MKKYISFILVHRLKIVILLCVALVTIPVVYIVVRDTSKSRKAQKTLNNHNLLVVGQYGISPNFKPLLLFINPTDFSIKQIDLNPIIKLGITGIYEARPLMIGDKYKIALGTYDYGTNGRGKLFILGSDDPYLSHYKIEFEETFGVGERVRAVYTGDVDGDGQDEVVIGTRPNGILKYYKYQNGKWIGTEIENIGMTIHELIITDSDRDGKNEIFVNVSTTAEYKYQNLQLKIPVIIKYTLSRGHWDKQVVWKPDNPIIQDGFRYEHPRYMFPGNFVGNGGPELVTGLGENLVIENLLMLKWNGSGYSGYSQNIGGKITVGSAVIASGDIDNNGTSEIILPTLTDDALLLYTWKQNTWIQQVLTNDLIDRNAYKETIISMAVLDSTSGAYKKIFYATSSENLADGFVKFYVLEYDSKIKGWSRRLVNNLYLPNTGSWGIFPMSPWKIYSPSKIPIN